MSQQIPALLAVSPAKGSKGEPGYGMGSITMSILSGVSECSIPPEILSQGKRPHPLQSLIPQWVNPYVLPCRAQK